jgi:septation ring formation regulator EzrA
LSNKKTLKDCYEERIQTLLKLKEANYKAYEELDKKIHKFSEYLESRRLEHQKNNDIFACSELFVITQKYDDIFFGIEAIPSLMGITKAEPIFHE